MSMIQAKYRNGRPVAINPDQVTFADYNEEGGPTLVINFVGQSQSVGLYNDEARRVWEILVPPEQPKTELRVINFDEQPQAAERDRE